MSKSLPILDSIQTEDWIPTEVHDWEGKETNCLVLNYTMACPLSCDFCCYGCHPKRTEKMPIDLALNLVEQGAEMGIFSCVGLTGGEPMMHLDEMFTIGSTLKKLKFPFTIATAGHWATTPDEAQRIVDVLADFGLLRLNISHDPSHSKFVPSSYVVNVARAASARQISTYIIGTFYSPSENLETYVPELSDIPYVKLVGKYVAKVGRAAKKPITQEKYNLRLELDGLACYRRIYHDIVVFYDGATYPCCSTFNRSTSGILIGNANEDSLRTLWERVEGSLMFRVMKRQGFSRVYEIVKQFDPELYKELPSVESTVGPCSLCHAIFQQPQLSSRMRDVFKNYEIEKISKVLGLLAQKVGDTEATNIIAASAFPNETIIGTTD